MACKLGYRRIVSKQEKGIIIRHQEEDEIKAIKGWLMCFEKKFS